MRLIATLIVLLLVLLVAAVFHVNNGQPVSVDFYFATVRSPLSLVVALALLAGALLGGTMNLWVLSSQRRKIAKLKRTLKKIERQTDPSTLAVKDAG